MKELKKLINKFIQKKGNINMKNNPQINIFYMANYIIKKCPDVTNMKLQKLMYYAHAKHLISNNKKPLFENKIEAWIYGPFIPILYFEFRNFEAEPLQPTESGNSEKLKKPEFKTYNESINYILELYGNNSGIELSEPTHSEKNLGNKTLMMVCIITLILSIIKLFLIIITNIR